MKEFTGALKKSPFAKEKLAWIGFDACLMSSIETAHLVTPYADYMIASEETEPCVGWSYDFLAGIEKDSDGKETGQRIVDSFMAAGEAANKASDKEAALTLACMDLSRTGDVEDKLNSFFKTLSKSLSPETFSELSNLREATREFGKAMSDSQRYDLVDLGDLIGNYAEHAPEEAEAFTQALQEMVVYSKSSLEGCSGLSSYHPYYNKTYYEKLWRKEYDSFAFAPYYRDYINNFATIWLGDAMGDWTQMNQVQYAGVEGETQYFSVQLTPEQVQYYASSNLLVLTEPYDGEYSQVFKTNKVTIDENGVLTAGYNGRTLYAVDENGTIVAGPLKYYISDDGHLEIIMMYENFESGAEQLYTHVIYECADAPAGSRIAFKYEGGTYDNYYLSIDDVFVGLVPTCLKPAAPKCDAKTAHTATLSWTNGAEGQNAWQIVVDTIAAFNPDTVNAARIIDASCCCRFRLCAARHGICHP